MLTDLKFACKWALSWAWLLLFYCGELGKFFAGCKIFKGTQKNGYRLGMCLQRYHCPIKRESRSSCWLCAKVAIQKPAVLQIQFSSSAHVLRSLWQQSRTHYCARQHWVPLSTDPRPVTCPFDPDLGLIDVPSVCFHSVPLINLHQTQLQCLWSDWWPE